MALNPRQKKIAKLKTSGDVFLFNEIERIEKKLPDLKQLIELLIGKKAERVETKNTDIKKKLAKLSDDSDFFLLKELQALEEQIPDITGLASAFQLKQPEKGDKGDTGATGESIKGDKGENGKDGVGLDGKDGRNGKDGANGSDGSDGKDGLDGNTITSEEIVEKINTLEEVVDYSVLKNVPDLKALENNIRGDIPRTGGISTSEILEDGIKTGSSHRLNFGSGFDTVMNNGTIDISLDASEPTNMNLQNITDNGSVTTNDITITDEGLITDYVDFDLTPLSTIQEGRMQWDADENTAVIGMTGGNVNLQVGQENLVHVINKSGADIANGKLVYSTGSQGNVLTIDLADNTDSDKIHILGMATENIANNATGYVSTFGKVRGTGTQPIDTSAFTEGDKLYLNSAGGWTKTHPSGAADAVIIFGHVLRVHATTGIIQMSNPEPFTIGNNFDGILRQSVINQNAGTSASSAFTAVNNAGHRSSLSMVGSNYTVVAGIAEAMVLYNQGYNKTVFAVDGNYGYEWWTDVTDSHNLSSTSKMSLSAAGALNVVDSITGDSIIKSGGLVTEFLKADGSVDSTTYVSTASDSAEIDFTITAGDITASIVTGSIDVLKLDAGVQTSLGLADSALQNIVEDVSPQLGANLDGQAFNITTTGLGTFGNLDVDTLNLNGNVISDSTGTVSFSNDHITTTGTVTAEQLTSTDQGDIANELAVGTTSGKVVIGDITGNARGTNVVEIQSRHTTATQVASGNKAVAIGVDNTSSNSYSNAFGSFNNVSGQSSTASGGYNTVTSDLSTASGYYNKVNGGATGTGSTASGYNNTASAYYATAIGKGNTASGVSSSAIGSGSTASSQDATSIGVGSTASGQKSTAVGQNADALGSGSTVLGNNQLISSAGTGSTAAGSYSTVSSNYSVAIGIGNTINTGSTYGLVVGASNTIAINTTNAGAIGTGITNSTANSVEIGPANTTKIRLNGGNLLMLRDNAKTLYGAGNDVSTTFDGSDWIFNSENVTANDEVHFTNFNALVTDGGRKRNTTRATTTYTILITDDIVFGNTDGSAWTATLPAGVEGQTFKIINSGSSLNNLTVAPNGSEHLIGANSNFTLRDGETLQLTYNATDGWY